MLVENIPRVLPDHCHAIVDTGNWSLPPIFALLQQGGNIAVEEMARTFNCGVGMAAIVSPEARDIFGDRAFEIGRIGAGPRGCTVHGKTGTWNSDEDWSATHNA